MLSLYNIFTVSRFEIKTLLRSWFFRIFAGLAIFILFWVNFGVLAVGEAPWTIRGLPSSIPYMNLLLLNAVQAVIAVFLASDFLKRDKKLDTTEVIYMRSMTNGDYVLGKTLGIFIVFMALNAIVLIIAAIFNLIASDVPFHPMSYLLYPLFISVPTLIFIFGLSFLFMVLIRNQAVTFIVLLGYIATTLFFLGNKFHHLFDYMAFKVPLVYSDFVGFGNVGEILIHRGIYFFLGLAFIFATIRLLRRLPQSMSMQRSALVFIFLFGGCGLWLGGVYLSRIQKSDRLRREMLTLNDRWVDAASVSIQRQEIHLAHRKTQIECSTDIVFQNTTDKSIDKYIFRLNPGLRVDGVECGGKEVSFDRDRHLLFVDASVPLQPLFSDSLTIRYGGTIKEDACYLDADPEIRERDYRVWMYQMDKRHAFITPDYVLLTPEAGWYPQAVVSFSPKRPEERSYDFIRFNLRLDTSTNLNAFSPGAVTEQGEGSFVF
ncbi:MAG: ABC transporter permease [bacterium]